MEGITEGLEALDTAGVVSSLKDFLSLDDLGYKETAEGEFIPLDDANETESDKQKSDTNPQENLESQGASSVMIKEAPAEDSGLDGLSDDSHESSNNSVGGEYKTLIKEMISNGLMTDIGAFETENGEVAFDEMNIDKEVFLSLLKNREEELKQKYTENKLDVQGVSDFTKRLINIEKNGGDVQRALETYQNVKHPIDNIDLSELRGQKAMVYLRLQAQGMDQETSKDLIKSYELQGNLEEKAYDSKQQLEAAFNESILQQDRNAEHLRQNEKRALKEYRVTLDSVLKQYPISDTHRVKLLNVATKEDDNGQIELDQLISNFRKNPNDAADLLMFITDKDGYIKVKSEEVVKEMQVKTLKTVNIIPKSRNTTSIDKNKQEDDYLIDLSRLK